MQWYVDIQQPRREDVLLNRTSVAGSSGFSVGVVFFLS